MTLPGETVGTGAAGPDEDLSIDGPKVMRSAGGWYVGYSYIDPEYGFEGPYSRESGYYRSFEEAEAALPSFIAEPDPAMNFHARGTQFDPSGLEVTELDAGLDDQSLGI